MAAKKNKPNLGKYRKHISKWTSILKRSEAPCMKLMNRCTKSTTQLTNPQTHSIWILAENLRAIINHTGVPAKSSRTSKAEKVLQIRNSCTNSSMLIQEAKLDSIRVLKKDRHTIYKRTWIWRTWISRHARRSKIIPTPCWAWCLHQFKIVGRLLLKLHKRRMKLRRLMGRNFLFKAQNYSRK